MTIDEMECRLDQYQINKYQTPVVDFHKATTKFSEECIELLKAIHKDDTANIKEEISDVMFCLHRLCRALGTDLMTLAAHKLPEVENKLKRK